MLFLLCPKKVVFLHKVNHKLSGIQPSFDLAFILISLSTDSVIKSHSPYFAIFSPASIAITIPAYIGTILNIYGDTKFLLCTQISALIPTCRPRPVFTLFSRKKSFCEAKESRAGTVAASKDTWRSIQWMKLFILRLLQHKLLLDIFIVISLRLIFLRKVWGLLFYTLGVAGEIIKNFVKGTKKKGK